MQPDAFAALVVMTVETTLAPVLERLASLETQYAALGDTRDRVIGLETKAAAPVSVSAPVDLSPILERIAVLETRAPVPGPAGPAGTDGKDGVDGRDGLAGKDGVNGKDGADGRSGIDGKDGLSGKDGANGLNGKDGADGVTLDDLSVVQDADERTLIVKATVGARVKELGRVTFPVPIYRQVYIEGKEYTKGELVTWGGAIWHCNDTTTIKPGGGGRQWTLAVKGGRDGRDAKPLLGPLPIVKAGD